MFKTRIDEPEYAKLSDADSQPKNQYGENIETVPEGNALRDQSLRINEDESVSENPNRYKQHGFHFTADNCIGCHACEAACSEKNDNPSHIAFRSVGFVESGTYPDYARINISMACNHCDNPVCLKGCPTRAYTKFAEYGAVLQDPDICFGCGYCTWVCPYNAPQLDPVKGQVSKCNMCVDRLEVGLKPACVSACLGNALDFGVIENTPRNREQVQTEIPGFPTTDITHPNIRFQLARTLQRVFTRPDSAPVKYVRTADRFLPEVDELKGTDQREWNLKSLLTSHENAHIAFTLSVQAVMGAFLLYLFTSWAGRPVPGYENLLSSWSFLPFMGGLLGVMAFGLISLNLHLGKPQFFYRGFYNWKLSPVSREIIGVSLFFTGLGAYAFFGLLGPNFLGLLNLPLTQILTFLSGLVAIAGATIGLYYMIKLYLIPARPYWNHLQTVTSFIGTCLSLGGLFGLWGGVFMITSHAQIQPLLFLTSSVMLAGLVLEAFGLWRHQADLFKANNEGAASLFEQSTRYGYPYIVRNLLLGGNIIALTLLLFFGWPEGYTGLWIGLLLTASILTSAIIGRALFYVLVIPTTMPGAFFWKNKGFEQHAQKTGIAHKIHAGIVHHG